MSYRSDLLKCQKEQVFVEKQQDNQNKMTVHNTTKYCSHGDK